MSHSINLTAIDATATESDKDSQKAMLRALFARHHRAAAKTYQASKKTGRAATLYQRARKLEAKVADYANDLIC